MHRLLSRQLKKLKLNNQKTPDLEQWIKFINRIEQSYEEADKDRYILENSLEISSHEMHELYVQQKDSFQARQSAILGALPDIVFLLDEEGLYLEIIAATINENLYRPEAELIGKKLIEVLPKTTVNRFLEVIGRAIETKSLQVINYELNVIGGNRFFEGRITPTGLRVNGKRTVIFLVRDVTNKIESEQQNVLLNKMMDSASEGFVVVNNDKKVLYANPAIETITGYSVDELISSGDGFLRHKMDEALCENLCEVAHSQAHQQREITIHKKQSGEETSVLLNLNTLRDEFGEISYFVGTLTDINALKKAKDQLQHTANHDSLTGLPNRLMFEDRLEQAVARSVRRDMQGALLFLDLDNFKNINDSLGHSTGDELLKQVAKRLLQVSRTEDTIARFGGDEFIIVQEDVSSILNVYRSAEKILNIFSLKFSLSEHEINIKTSIGITFFPEHGIEPENLIKQADAAMYSAKEAGRNCYHLYQPEMGDSVLQSLTIDMELNEALLNEDFYLDYQPQYALKSHTISGFEALIRWKHHKNGIVLPVDFIPAAESSGFIYELGLWVFKSVCLQCVKWSIKGYEFKRLSLNVSPTQLLNINLLDDFAGILNLTGAIDFISQIECEITESAIIQKDDISFNNLVGLSKLGFSLAIDDFGTGHSSLINLKRFPLDRLKIDREFIKDVGIDASDEAVIHATIALAQAFQLEVVAEGVENEIQLAFLKQVGCEEVQGFYFNRPLSIQKAEQLLLNLNNSST